MRACQVGFTAAQGPVRLTPQEAVRRALRENLGLKLDEVREALSASVEVDAIEIGPDGELLAEAMIKALAPACPERAIAGFQRRLRGEAYDAVVDEFVRAVKQRFPKAKRSGRGGVSVIRGRVAPRGAGAAGERGAAPETGCAARVGPDRSAVHP